jgi:insecticidal toxin complex protein TccC
MPLTSTLSPFTQTPMISVQDNRGLGVRILQYNITPAPAVSRSITASATPDQRLARTVYDPLGRAESAIDARLFAANAAVPNLQAKYSLTEQTLRSDSVDAGFSVTLLDAEGRAVWQTDGRNTVRRWEYETTLGRPLALYEQPDSLDERVSERFIYADASADSQALNLCGQCTEHYDTAGLNARQSMTITGHPLEQQRTLLADVTSAADWTGDDPADWAALLGGTVYVTAWQWDATGNMLGQTDAKGNIQRLSYSVDGQLAASWLTLDGQTEQPIITSLSYSAAGQKLQEIGGNGVTTDYHYEPQTQRLLGITTTRPESSGVTAATLQSLNYGYDPVGNILTVSNDSEATRFYRNQKVTPESTYAYDALYQLISASGRESSTNTNQSPGLSALITPIPTDSTQYVNYTRSYTYDRGGNLTQISHNGASQYTTAITVSDTSNHAVQAVSGLTASDVESQFDANGNQNALQSGSPALAWTLRNELQQVTPVVRGGDDDDKEIYLYDGGNMRIVKQTTQLTGSTTQTQTVIYLPGLELRTTNNGTTDTEVLQVVTVGEAGRAQVRVLHWDSGEPDGITGDVLRYSYGDQIGSCQLELDSTGQVISQEEYYPYGGTALWAARSSTEADYKTRRYSGKERDATGLYYYGYRYYQPWIGRWLSADPAGTVDGLNLYRMVRNNPINYIDMFGEIAKTAHYIWLGNNSIPADAMSNIIDFKAKNSEFTVNLWVDRPDKLISDLINRGYSQAFLKRINVNTIENFGPHIDAAIGRELADTAYKNYAAASDILRLAILERHGGIYMDVDVATRKSLGGLNPQRQSTTGPSTLLIHQEVVDGRVRISNAVIASEKNGPDIKKMLRYAVSPYDNQVFDMGFARTRGKGEITRALARFSDFSLADLMWEGKRSVPSIRHALTIAATGPGVVSSYLNASGLSPRMQLSKTILEPENFGQRSTPLGEWKQGMNAEGRWVVPRVKARAATV